MLNLLLFTKIYIAIKYEDTLLYKRWYTELDGCIEELYMGVAFLLHNQHFTQILEWGGV